MQVLKSIQRKVCDETTFKGHTEDVADIQITNEFLISASEDNTIKLFEIEGVKCLHTFEKHTQRVTQLVLEDDSSNLNCESHTCKSTRQVIAAKSMFSSSKDGSILKWDLTTMSFMATVKEPDTYEQVTCLSYQGSRHALFAGTSKGRILLFDLQKEFPQKGVELKSGLDEEGQPLYNHIDKVNKLVCVVINEKYMVISAGEEGRIIVWYYDGLREDNDKELEAYQYASERDPPVTSLIVVDIPGDPISQIGKSSNFFLIAGCENGMIAFFDMLREEKEAVAALQGHHQEVTSLLFHVEDNALYSSSKDKTILQWDASIKKLSELYPQLVQGLRKDEKRVFVEADEGFNSNENSGPNSFLFQSITAVPTTLRLSADKSTLFVARTDNLVSYFALENEVRRLVYHSLEEKALVEELHDNNEEELIQVNCLEITKDGNIFIIGYSDSNIAVFNQQSKTLKRLQGHKGALKCFTISYNDQYLYSAAEDNLIIKWSLRDLKQVETFSDHPGKINALAISSDNRMLFSGSSKSKIIKWNLDPTKSPTLIGFEELEGHEQRVTCLALSPDNELLFSGSADKTVRKWRVKRRNQTGQYQCNLMEGHNDEVTAIQCAADNKTVYSASLDNTIRIWDLAFKEKGRKDNYHVLQGLDSEIISLALTKDGLTLYSGQADQTVVEWSTNTYQKKTILNGHDPSLIRVSKDNANIYFKGIEIETTHDSKIKEFHVREGILTKSLFGNQSIQRYHPLVYVNLKKMIKKIPLMTKKQNMIIPRDQISYINFPELMLLQDYPAKEIFKVAKSHGYLNQDLSIERQQTWVFKLAIDQERSELIELIMNYYIEDPTKWNIVFFDQEIEIQLIKLNFATSAKFLQSIQKVQVNTQFGCTKGSLANGRESTTLADTLVVPDDFDILLDEFEVKVDEGQSDLEHVRFGICVTSKRTSQQTIDYFEILQEADSQTILLKKPMILEQWDRYYKFHLIRALVFWLFVFTLNYYIIYEPRSYFWLYSVYFLNTLQLIVELKALMSRGKAYFGDFMNIFELYIYIMVYYLAMTSFFRSRVHSNSRKINASTLILVNIRSMIYLGVFSGPRYLIAMIIAVFKDFYSFATIVVAFLLTFSFTDIYLSENGSTQKGYSQTLMSNYMVALGEFGDYADVTPIRKMMFLVYTVVLMVVMMNLLIAIISDTYVVFSQSQDEFNLRELLDMMIELQYLFKTNTPEIQKWDVAATEIYGGYQLTNAYKQTLVSPGLCRYKQGQSIQVDPTMKRINEIAHNHDHKIGNVVKTCSKLGQIIQGIKGDIENLQEDQERKFEALEQKIDKLLALGGVKQA